MTDRQAMPVALRIVVMSRFPPGQVSKRDDCIQGGAVRAHLTFQAVGMTRATTASTSPAAASRCGSSSARSACSKRPIPRCASASSQTRSAANVAGNSTGSCGCRYPPVILCRGWLSTVCTAHSGPRCRVGRTRTRLNECCIGPRQRRPCTWPRCCEGRSAVPDRGPCVRANSVARGPHRVPGGSAPSSPRRT
jgi:hypothetical protein